MTGNSYRPSLPVVNGNRLPSMSRQKAKRNRLFMAFRRVERGHLLWQEPLARADLGRSNAAGAAASLLAPTGQNT